MQPAEASAFAQAARCLAELGHPHRLLAFQLLVKAGDRGLAVGEIEREIKIPRSTLAHHLTQLVGAGLVTQTREGRVQRCRIEPERTKAFLIVLGNCCEGLPGLSPDLLNFSAEPEAADARR